MVLPAAAGAGWSGDAKATHIAPGSPVGEATLKAWPEGSLTLPRGRGPQAWLFVRPGHDRSLRALKTLAACRDDLRLGPVAWTVVAAEGAGEAELRRAAEALGPEARGGVDAGDRLYGALGVANHPALALVGSDGKLLAFEPWRAVNFCAVASARARQAAGELDDAQVARLLDPAPTAPVGGNGAVANRYRAMAESLLKSGDKDKALATVRKGLERDANAISLWRMAHRLEAEAGRCPAAKEAFERLRALDPANAGAPEACAPPR